MGLPVFGSVAVVRAALRSEQVTQARARFANSVGPPCERGETWSTWNVCEAAGIPDDNRVALRTRRDMVNVECGFLRCLGQSAVFADIACPLANLPDQSHGNLRTHRCLRPARSARSFINESKSTRTAHSTSCRFNSSGSSPNLMASAIMLTTARLAVVVGNNT